jgi:hypothetical protein
MLIDIYELHPCGRVGKLLDTFDAPRTFDSSVQYGGKRYKLLTGLRAFICMPKAEWMAS